MNTRTLLLGTMLAVFFFGAIGAASVAFSEGQTGQYTLEEALEIQRRRIEAAEANPASGSGTPYLDADGVLGAAAISAAVFGGIAGALLLKGRSGKYAAMGRG